MGFLIIAFLFTLLYFYINDTRKKGAVGRAMVLGNLQCNCILLMMLIIRQGWALFESFFLSIIVSLFFSRSLGQYRLTCCLKGR